MLNAARSMVLRAIITFIMGFLLFLTNLAQAQGQKPKRAKVYICSHEPARYRERFVDIVNEGISFVLVEVGSDCEFRPETSVDARARE